MEPPLLGHKKASSSFSPLRAVVGNPTLAAKKKASEFAANMVVGNPTLAAKKKASEFAANMTFDNEKNVTFSGKIDILPFVYEQPARRSSVNRVAGTIERKPISFVTREVNEAFLISKVLPAIKSMWPREDVGKTIYIEQDNARSHIAKNDPDFYRAASEDGFDIQMTCQPPNSLDLNVSHLGFFNAIQSLQQQEPVNLIDELMNAVQRAFNEFSCQQSDKFFSTLQSCMIEIMNIKGSNKYKISHMKTYMLYNQSCIHTQLSCDSSLVQEVIEYLQNFDV
ncbi:uncharacterized protein LOC131625398 [Vicia villosa]|uniref:uncharacterized protein LOC131625398 n=1 Tax=Vicia villosa TaxID=3911 RepID=UPI00273B5EEA|nr:uncharacterized protein LOC131625398 [Vicia villosa]